MVYRQNKIILGGAGVIQFYAVLALSYVTTIV